MPAFPSLANLLAPPEGKMRLVSSQDRQPPSGMMARIASGEPGKMVEIPPGESFILADLPGAGQIVRIWMTTMNMPGQRYNFNHYGLLRFYWDGEESPSVEARPPASPARNAYQFVLFSSPLWALRLCWG